MNNFSNTKMACFKAALAVVVVKNRLKQLQHQHGKKRPVADDNYKKNPKKPRTADSLIFSWSSSTPREMPASSQKEHLESLMTKAVRKAHRMADDKSDASWWSLRALTAHLAQQLSLSLVSKQHFWVEEWIRECLLQLLATADDCSNKTSTRRTNCIRAAFLVWRGILLGDLSTCPEEESKSPKVVPSPTCRRLFKEAFCSILQQEIINPKSVTAYCSDRALEEQACSFAKKPTETDNRATNCMPPSSNEWQRLFSAPHCNLSERRRMLVCLDKRLDVWLVHGLQLLQKINNGLGQSVLPGKSFLPPSNWTQWYAQAADQRLMDPTSVLDPGAKLMTMVTLYQAQGEAFCAKTTLTTKTTFDK